MDWIVLLFALIGATLFGIAGLLLGELRGGRPASGFWLGFLFGPLGVLVAGFEDARCPACRSGIARDARKCRRCHEPVTPAGEAAATVEVPAPDALADAMTRAKELRAKP